MSGVGSSDWTFNNVFLYLILYSAVSDTTFAMNITYRAMYVMSLLQNLWQVKVCLPCIPLDTGDAYMKQSLKLFLTNYIDFNPSMDKWVHSLWSVGSNYLSIPKLQRCNRLSLGKDKQFHPILFWPCDYLAMLRFKLTHVRKMKYSWIANNTTTVYGDVYIIHWGFVTHACFSKLNQYCFRWWFAARCQAIIRTWKLTCSNLKS